MISIQQAFRRYALDHLGQLPSQMHGILHPGIEPLAANGVMNMRSIARQEDPPLPINFRLPRHVGEAGNPTGTVYPVIGAIDGDQSLAEIAQSRLASALQRP